MSELHMYFVRHAEPDYESPLYGPGHFPGPPLTHRGLLQAADLARQIGNRAFDAVFCSDYLRTMETIAQLKTQLPIGVEYDPRIREVADVLNGYKEYNDFEESEGAQRLRLNSFLDELQGSRNSVVLVVTHFNVIEFLSRQLGTHIKKPRFAEVHYVRYLAPDTRTQ